MPCQNSKVLVRYHPLAGRLMTSSEGKPIVDCSGEGALFIEAEANCKINDIGDIAKSDPATLGKLVYEIPGAQIILQIPPVVAQLTIFNCGGFFLGLRTNQCMKILFALDGRSRFEPPPIPDNFGNAIFLANSACKAGELMDNQLSYEQGWIRRLLKWLMTVMRSAIDRLFTSYLSTQQTSNHNLSGPVSQPEKEVMLLLSHGKERKNINVIFGTAAAAMKIFEEPMKIRAIKRFIQSWHRSDVFLKSIIEIDYAFFFLAKRCTLHGYDKQE
uniref:Uncharacterized protein n=1 Tax=Salix viminalis TaxID=40686 RepID=A0A6N2ME89_SALVM